MTGVGASMGAHEELAREGKEGERGRGRGGHGYGGVACDLLGGC
jgi:hypothetical protein